jgi:hypothetical protein
MEEVCTAFNLQLEKLGSKKSLIFNRWGISPARTGVHPIDVVHHGVDVKSAEAAVNALPMPNCLRDLGKGNETEPKPKPAPKKAAAQPAQAKKPVRSKSEKSQDIEPVEDEDAATKAAAAIWTDMKQRVISTLNAYTPCFRPMTKDQKTAIAANGNVFTSADEMMKVRSRSCNRFRFLSDFLANY